MWSLSTSARMDRTCSIPPALYVQPGMLSLPLWRTMGRALEHAGTPLRRDRDVDRQHCHYAMRSNNCTCSAGVARLRGHGHLAAESNKAALRKSAKAYVAKACARRSSETTGQNEDGTGSHPVSTEHLTCSLRTSASLTCGRKRAFAWTRAAYFMSHTVW